MQIEPDQLWEARRRQQAEELVRMEVMAASLADMPEPSLRQKLAAEHYRLSSTVSRKAIAARLWS